MSFTDLADHLAEVFGGSGAPISLSESISLGLRVSRRPDDAEDLLLRRMAYRAGRPLPACRYCGATLRRCDASVCSQGACRSRRSCDWQRQLSGPERLAYLAMRRERYDRRRSPCVDCRGRREVGLRSPRCRRCLAAHRRRLAADRQRRHRQRGARAEPLHLGRGTVEEQIDE